MDVVGAQIALRTLSREVWPQSSVPEPTRLRVEIPDEAVPPTACRAAKAPRQLRNREARRHVAEVQVRLAPPGIAEQADGENSCKDVRDQVAGQLCRVVPVQMFA